jgi:hypothetical protein
MGKQNVDQAARYVRHLKPAAGLAPDHDNFVIQGGLPCRVRRGGQKIGNDRQLPVAGRAMARAWPELLA